MRQLLTLVICALCVVLPVCANEQDAITISQNIQQRHVAHGLMVDPVFASPSSDEIVAFGNAGHSAYLDRALLGG
jgi:hypothetical protein